MLSGVHRGMTLPCLAATAVAASTLLHPLTAATALAPSERILDDSGGRIGGYLIRYEALRKSSQRVVIDGTCASACTLLLGVIALCDAARGACLPAAWDPSLTGAQTNKPATRYLWSHYPIDVRRWIARHGGLRSEPIYLGGRELA